MESTLEKETGYKSIHQRRQACILGEALVRSHAAIQSKEQEGLH